MFRWNFFVVLTLVVCGFAFETRCEAQQNTVTCLQYPIYYDDEGTYLFVVDEYPDNSPTGCSNFEGEYYAWVSTDPPYECPLCPEACGACGAMSNYISVAAARARKDGKSATSDVPSSDVPFKTLLPATYRFGHDFNGAALPTKAFGEGKLFNPSAGIQTLATSWVNVQPTRGGMARGNPIPVKLFTVALNYQAAGLPQAKWPNPTGLRYIRVGFEMESPSGDANPLSAPLTASRPDNSTRRYQGIIDMKVDNEIFSYHIVTKTPLF